MAAKKKAAKRRCGSGSPVRAARDLRRGAARQRPCGVRRRPGRPSRGCRTARRRRRRCSTTRSSTRSVSDGGRGAQGRRATRCARAPGRRSARAACSASCCSCGRRRRRRRRLRGPAQQGPRRPVRQGGGVRLHVLDPAEHAAARCAQDRGRAGQRRVLAAPQSACLREGAPAPSRASGVSVRGRTVPVTGPRATVPSVVFARRVTSSPSARKARSLAVGQGERLGAAPRELEQAALAAAARPADRAGGEQVAGRGSSRR